MELHLDISNFNLGCFFLFFFYSFQKVYLDKIKKIGLNPINKLSKPIFWD